jgi:hypothetical protein
MAKYLKLLIAIVLVSVMFGGCIKVQTPSNAQPANELQSGNYQKEFRDAVSLLNSSNNRMSSISGINDLSKINLGLIKGIAAGSKSDLNEAQKILDKIPPNALKGQEKADIEALKVIIKINIEVADMTAGPFADMVDRLKRIDQTTAQTYPIEIQAIKADMNNIKALLSNMDTELNRINLENLSPKNKGDIISMRAQIQYHQKLYEDLITDLDSKCLKKCDFGYILGTDCQCHPACGSSYCGPGGQCCQGTCYKDCPIGYYMTMDCSCYPI